MVTSAFKIAAAQTSSVTGNIALNVANHVRVAEAAASHGVDMVVFPELSLTGYERILAAELALHTDSPQLHPLQAAADKFNIAILAGCPIASNESRPYIGTFIVTPNQPIAVYKKRFVHSDEDPYFVSGNDTIVITQKDSRVGIAICADIHNDKHPADVAAVGADIYAAGVAITPSAIQRALTAMAGHAAKHNLLAVISNYSERTGDFDIGGQSAIWDKSGKLLAKAGEDNECLVIATAEDGQWVGRVVDITAAK